MNPKTDNTLADDLTASDTQTPVADPAPVTPPEPAVEEPALPPNPPVPGSVETPPVVGEQVAPLQPEAPNPVPATAEPFNDAVTVRTNLQTVAEKLTDVHNFVNEVLSDHPLAESILKDVENLVKIVSDELK